MVISLMVMVLSKVVVRIGTEPPEKLVEIEGSPLEPVTLIPVPPFSVDEPELPDPEAF